MLFSQNAAIGRWPVSGGAGLGGAGYPRWLFSGYRRSGYLDVRICVRGEPFSECRDILIGDLSHIAVEARRMEVGMATKLDRLLEKEAQIKAQIQQAKAAERTLEKKSDTRRKILVGAAVFARVENGEWPESDLKMMMDGFLTRPNERELFGLSEQADSSAAGTGAEDEDPKANASDKKPFGKYSTAQKKATKEKLRLEREESGCGQG